MAKGTDYMSKFLAKYDFPDKAKKILDKYNLGSTIPYRDLLSALDQNHRADLLEKRLKKLDKLFGDSNIFYERGKPDARVVPIFTNSCDDFDIDGNGSWSNARMAFENARDF